MPRTEFTTPKGLTLTIMDLRGKEYMPVDQRVLWMRTEKPGWAILTEPLSVKMDSETQSFYALFKATIYDETGRTVSVGHKFCAFKDFKDYIEKAEKGSVGRALAFAGFGTQFAVEIEDEDENDLADAPQEPAAKPLGTDPALANVPPVARKIAGIPGKPVVGAGIPVVG